MPNSIPRPGAPRQHGAEGVSFGRTLTYRIDDAPPGTESEALGWWLPLRTGTFDNSTQLYELLMTMKPASYIVIQSPRQWFTQAFCTDVGPDVVWVVELGLVHPTHNDVFHYLNEGDHHFPFERAFDMLCQLCAKQALDEPQEYEYMRF